MFPVCVSLRSVSVVIFLLALAFGLGARAQSTYSIPVTGGGTLTYTETIDTYVPCESVTAPRYTFYNFVFNVGGGTYSLGGSVTWEYVCNNNTPPPVPEPAQTIQFTLPQSLNSVGCTITVTAEQGLSATLTPCNYSLIQGYINPKYIIMGVTYAPPGGNSSSYVSYANTTFVGNASQVSHSFSNNFTSSVSIATGANVNVLGAKAGSTVTGTQSNAWTQTQTSSNTITITKQNAVTLKTPGVPNIYSPINHDYDIIWLWLNPVLLFTVYSTNTSAGGTIEWNGYGYDLSDPLQEIDVWPVYVGYLNGDFGPIDAQDLDAFSRSWVTTQTFAPGDGPGIQSSDYPNILAADPFAYNPYDQNTGYVLSVAPGSVPPTSTDGRFTLSELNNATPQTIPYAQAPLNSSSGESETYVNQYSTSNVAVNGSSFTYAMGFGLEEKFGASFFGLGAASYDFKQNWTTTWVNSSQTTITNTSTQTDTAQITGPPCPATTPPCNPNYTEPHEFAVYQDNIFGTFMFWPNPYFSISQVSPASKSVAAGATASYTISTLANAGFTGTSIDIIVSGLPAGATSNTLSGTPGSNFTLNVSTSTSTPAGSYPLTIEAFDGSQSYFAYATLVVTTPTVVSTTTALAISPTGGTLTPNESYTLTATVTPASGSAKPTGNVVFSIGSTTQTVALNSSGVATYSGTAPATAGTLTLSVAYQGATGFSGSTSSTLTETIAGSGQFSITPTNNHPAQTALSLGHSMSYNIAVTPLNGFSGTVNLAVSGLPTGITATLSPASITTSGNATLTLQSAYRPSTFIGNSTITVTGTTGSLQESASFALMTQPLQYAGYCSVPTTITRFYPNPLAPF